MRTLEYQAGEKRPSHLPVALVGFILAVLVFPPIMGVVIATSDLDLLRDLRVIVASLAVPVVLLLCVVVRSWKHDRAAVLWSLFGLLLCVCWSLVWVFIIYMERRWRTF